MRKAKLLRASALFIAFLIVFLPICHAEELNLIYDDNGNLVSGDGKYRVYNSLNQLWKVYNGTSAADPLLQEYIYHPVEESVLVKKTYNVSDESVLETVYYFSKENVRVVNSTGTYDYLYIYHEGQLVAQEVNGEVHYIHPENLGSSTVVTDENGTVVESTTYSPYGEVISGGETSRYDYEGQEFDSVLGESDFNFRHYKPEWAIFTQPDTLIQNVYDPQMLNRYAFERGNPYKYTDPSGHIVQFMKGISIIGEKVKEFVKNAFEWTNKAEQATQKESILTSDKNPATQCLINVAHTMGDTHYKAAKYGASEFTYQNFGEEVMPFQTVSDNAMIFSESLAIGTFIEFITQPIKSIFNTISIPTSCILGYDAGDLVLDISNGIGHISTSVWERTTEEIKRITGSGGSISGTKTYSDGSTSTTGTFDDGRTFVTVHYEE